MLQHPLPCQVCSAGPSWQRHQCSLGTASVPCPQGASAPLEAKIYCWEGGLCFRDSAWRVSYPGTLVSAWGAGEGAELFSQACPFRPQSQAQGGFVAPYLLLRLWKVCQKKEVIFFFFCMCVRAAWKHCSLFLLCTPPGKADQNIIVGGGDLCCSKPSCSWPYPLADFPRKGAREYNPTSAVGTVA